MVVDDDPSLRAVVAAILEDKGYRVVVAADAFEALEIIALLRAVNVGGTGTLAMTDLKSLCEG